MRQKIMEFKNLTFSYEGEGRVLDEVSLSIYEGERIAVLGENGAGKSTFFLNMNGVREPDGGEILHPPSGRRWLLGLSIGGLRWRKWRTGRKRLLPGWDWRHIRNVPLII